jgi:peptidoglycan/LPS O-acetylase OafA/YrhL
MQTGMQTGGYRRDIDGLRSLAILPVLLFHANIPGFSGGFVGVDIFFVISGFLIAGIIAREIDARNFSLVRFYERRARRILPALFAMIAFVLLGASWLYLPGDFESVPRSALMALAFLANVWFFAKTGYFAGGAETMPLLHCWSLGVEEQFYIGFPLLLWLIARYVPRGRVIIVAAAALVSLAWALWTQANGDGFAFYMLPPRAWELFAGALLALGAVPEIRQKALREALAMAGIGLIAFAVFTYDRHTLFPGMTAIPPVLGSALLLHCAPGTVAGRLLSMRLPVAIGLISYSLYLWHWPLIVFTEYARDERLSGLWSIGVIAAALLAAWTSWRFIERPFRNPQSFDRRRIFAGSVAGMAGLGLVAAAMLPLGGWESRFAPEVVRLAAAKQDFSPRREDCLAHVIGGDRPECTFGAAVAPSAMLWGDSHGVELAWLLGQEMARNGESLMQRTSGSCPPVLGYAKPDDPVCPQINAEVIERIEHTPSLRKVYLAAFWDNGVLDAPGTIAKLDATIARIRAAGKSVTIIGPVPPQPFNVPRRLAGLAAQGRLAEALGTSAASHAQSSAWLTAHYPRWQAQGITILDPARALVSGGETRIISDGKPLYFDSHHLSLAGARAVLEADPRR